MQRLTLKSKGGKKRARTDDSIASLLTRLTTLTYAAVAVSELPLPSAALLNDPNPLPRLPTNHNQSCALDSILATFWAMSQYTLFSSRCSQLWHAVNSFVTHDIPTAQTLRALNYNRDQLWRQMFEQNVDCPVGTACNCSDMMEKLLLRVGTVAQRLMFDFYFTIHTECDSCNQVSNISASSETYLNAYLGDYQGDVSHLTASFAGAAVGLDCEHCNQPKALSYRCDVKPNRFTIITNVQSLLDDTFLDKWPVRESYLNLYNLRLVAVIINIGAHHYITACQEKGKEWILYDDMHGAYRSTLANIVKLFEWEHSKRLRPFAEVLVYRKC